MNIATKQNLASASALAVIGLIAAAIVWTSTEVEDAGRQRRQTTEIVQRYSELRMVSFDYLRNRNERARLQWYAVSARINQLIAANDFQAPEQQAIVADLRERRALASRLFAELAATTDAADEPPMRRFETQLVSRLLIDQQDSLADAFRLAELTGERIDTAQKRLVAIILVGLALIALITGALWRLIHSSLLAPIIALQRITQALAAGNLGLSLGRGGDDEIGALSRDFDAMTQALRDSFARLEFGNRKLAAANAELEAFSYSVSHDLRAPLRRMDEFSLVLIEDHGERLDEEGRDALQRIRAASQRMGALIDDLLRLSKVGLATLDASRVDLSAMARTIADEIDSEATGRPVQWAIQPGLSVHADAALLRIALQNQLQNARKFSAGTPLPVIRVGARQGAAGTEYFVADNGAGFDMAQTGRLFGAFQRLHRSEDFPGTGIGLAIVRRIVRRHGGEIRAEAKPGQGATFFFSLKEPENEQDN